MAEATFPRSEDRGLIEALQPVLIFWGRRKFPRSEDRGLIEAFARRVALIARRTFPRSEDRGLIEASHYFPPFFAWAYFRDPRIAASLKQECGDILRLLVVHFRDPRIAASLKRASASSKTSCPSSFPRSEDRGLIEAGFRRRPKAFRPVFPRSEDRGLIEAMPLLSYQSIRWQFPRSEDRGLIEAGYKFFASPAPASFPRSEDRGLIEAGCPTACPHRCRDFRDPRIAASLKRLCFLALPCLALPFPRSEDRGLIEATSLTRPDETWAAHFRDPRIAASLKPCAPGG